VSRHLIKTIDPKEDVICPTRARVISQKPFTEQRLQGERQTRRIGISSAHLGL
jgi:hypothetical protein